MAKYHVTRVYDIRDLIAPIPDYQSVPEFDVTLPSINSRRIPDGFYDYGGWGIRRGRRGWAYNVSGNRGVLLQLENEKTLLIGSQRPDELAAAIEAQRGR